MPPAHVCTDDEYASVLRLYVGHNGSMDVVANGQQLEGSMRDLVPGPLLTTCTILGSSFPSQKC